MNRRTIQVRYAELSDAEGVNAVYNPFIETSPATFETEPYDTVRRREWLAASLADPRHPVVVAIDGDEVVGFANAAAYDPRQGYARSVKTSVFAAADRPGQGIGGALYEALMAALAKTDVHRAYAIIVAPNPASEALHRRFGFARVAVLSEVGHKFGRAHDVIWYEKRFDADPNRA